MYQEKILEKQLKERKFYLVLWKRKIPFCTHL